MCKKSKNFCYDTKKILKCCDKLVSGSVGEPYKKIGLSSVLANFTYL